MFDHFDFAIGKSGGYIGTDVVRVSMVEVVCNFAGVAVDIVSALILFLHTLYLTLWRFVFFENFQYILFV